MELGSAGRNVLDFLGFDTSRIPAHANPELYLETEPSSYGVFVLIGAIVLIAAVVFFFYLKELDTCPRPVKIFLGIFRFVVLLLMVLIFLGPSVRWSEYKDRAPYVVILRDASDSMDVVDTYIEESGGSAEDSSSVNQVSLVEQVASATGRSVDSIHQDGISRTEILNTLIERDDFAFIHGILQRGHVRIIDFGDSVETRVRRMEASSDENGGSTRSSGRDNAGLSDLLAALKSSGKDVSVSPLVADAQATDLHRAIKEALAVNPLAAIIIFTDGQHTAGDETLNDPVTIAQKAGEMGVPIYVVGVGDTVRKRNLKVADIYVRRKVWPDEPFEIDAVIASQGIAAQEVKVELVEHKLPAIEEELDLDKGDVVESRTVKLPEEDRNQRISFSRTLQQPGKYRYSVRVQELQGESDTKDNRDVTESTLEVVDEKVRVLLIAGTASWDFQLVKNLLTRDNTIAVSTWLQTLDKERPQEGDAPITKLPVTRKELAEYHVVMMFDPNPSEFDAEWVELLNDFVSKQAGGFLYMAGQHYSGIFLSLKRTSALTKLLPVRFDEGLESDLLIESTTFNRQAWPLRPVIQNISHPIMRFYEDPRDTLHHWEHMPGVFWSFPSKGAKETTQVLLEHSDTTLQHAPRPLIVAGRYGAGSTVFMGINETFRWRRVGRQAEYYDRFWIQVVRYLVETRSLQGRRRGYVKAQQERYSVGEKVILVARLKDAAYDDLREPEVEATITRADSAPKSVTLKRLPSRPGYYESTDFRPQNAGQYTVTVRLPGSGEGDAEVITTSFDVTLPNREANPVWLNEKLLTDVAKDSGGKYFRVNEVNNLLATVPNRREQIEIPSKPVLLFSPDDQDDRRFSWILIAFVVLLGVEWAVRKGCKLL